MKYRLSIHRNWTPHPRRNLLYTQADNYRVPEDISEEDAEAAIRAGIAARIDPPKPVIEPEEKPKRKWRKKAPENKVMDAAPEDKSEGLDELHRGGDGAVADEGSI